MNEYHRLWIMLRHRLTEFENNEESLLDKETYHTVLTIMDAYETEVFLDV